MHHRLAADEQQVADVIFDAMSMTSRASCKRHAARALGSNLERAKPQKSQSALQMLVMANWR
jgi:hypothetical protein